ncbi:MAG: hypothetical protein EOO51_01420 [Flavobacterium sp.]|nr:MAG: hypothetical protein EOO51_01420 [Flavobacterium sp.]
MKSIVTLLLFISIANIYSQNQDSFTKGFNKGFKETCDDAGFQSYSNYGDSRECQSTKVYGNETNVAEKRYADGYRCGVQQALKFIEKWKNQEKKKQSVTIQSPNVETPAVVDYPVVKSDVNIDKNVKNYSYDTSRPAANYGHYIEPVNTDILVKALNDMENSSSNYRTISEAERKRMFVNQMLYRYDDKWLKSAKARENKTLRESDKIKKELQKKQSVGDIFKIQTLSDGWYKVITNAEITTYRMIEVKNKNVVSWINGNNIKFPTTGLKEGYSNDYYLNIYLPDGKTIEGKFYITENKPMKRPKFYEPAILLVYSRNPFDDTLYTRVFNDNFNELRGTELNWNSDSNPKCNDTYRVIQFILPMNQSFEFHSNTRTSFWKGKIITDAPCKSQILN